MRAPNVRMGVLLAAWRGWHVEPARLFIQMACITDTCAPVSARKRRPDFVHVITGCCCCGTAEVALTVDPHDRFPGCVIWNETVIVPTHIVYHLRPINKCLNRKHELWSPKRDNIESIHSECLESPNPVSPNNEDARS